MISHRFLERFVDRPGQQQTLELLNQLPEIAYASLCASGNYQHDLAVRPPKEINKNELRRNDIC